jgi:glycerol-3-phosphate dehydrogenase (NAD(P)+)
MSAGDKRIVGVLGAGAWGTALANVAARAGADTLLWARDVDHAEAMRREGVNARRLPGVSLAAAVAPTADLAAAGAADIILAAVPAQALRGLCERLGGVARKGAPIVICAKGIERGTENLLSEIVAQTLPDNSPAVLSGPSFAADVARGLPTAVTLAAHDEALAKRLVEALALPTFRLYHSSDVRGVEIGGAAKNVLAIACGIAQGRGLGASAGAALVARGFAELARFGAAYGARPETLMGLSGLGDLVLTCGSAQSRNFSLGLALGRGADPASAAGGKLAEGAFTASVLVAMAQEKNVDMPIATAVDAVLRGRLTIDRAIEALLMRPSRGE